MDKLVNGIMKGLDYFNMREYLTRMIYQPDDLQKEFNKEKTRVNQMFEMTQSQIKNRKLLIKELENLVEYEDVKSTFIKSA